jgi:geranylgeranyl diphosphate synthase, type I
MTPPPPSVESPPPRSAQNPHSLASLASLEGGFPALLAFIRPAIEDRIAALFAEKLASIRRYGPEVVAIIDASRDLTLRGGKRYRAALLAAAYGGLDPNAPLEPALQGGVAIELLQSYLLIQDDWMDGDITRRGGPTVHTLLSDRLGARVGPAGAILASDFTWGMALEVLCRIDAPALRRIAMIQLFAAVHADVVIGQQIDMLGHPEDVEAMHDLKTGSYTVRGPLALGATLAGAPETTLAALEHFAAPIGVAFQLRDDLLGTFGSPAETGKPVGNDLRAGKHTSLIAEAEARLDAAGRAAIGQVLGKVDASDADIQAATTALDACGARAAVAARLYRLCDLAEALAADLPLAPIARTMLAGAAGALRSIPK